MSKPLLIYLPEGFADWEGAYLFPELVQNKVPFVTASENGKPVTTIGRLKVIPDAALTDYNAENISGLILIGSDSWAEPDQNHKALALAGQLLQKDVLVGAICGATVALAREGFLNDRRHTSNDLVMLKKMVPSYKGEQHYIHSLAISDHGKLITASGSGPVEFTLEVMRALNIYTEEKRQQWYALFKNGVQPPMEFWM